MSRRAFTAALYEDRCKWDIKLKDGSGAQCMRAKTGEYFCAQHTKMNDSFHCDGCGGNDEPRTDHCMDCESHGAKQGGGT